MPGWSSRFCSGSGGCDLSAEGDPCLGMSYFSDSVLSVSALFVIEKDAVLPERLSRLLGVLHLFVHLGIVIFQCVTHRCLRLRWCYRLTRRCPKLLFLSTKCTPWTSNFSQIISYFLKNLQRSLQLFGCRANSLRRWCGSLYHWQRTCLDWNNLRKRIYWKKAVKLVRVSFLTLRRAKRLGLLYWKKAVKLVRVSFLNYAVVINICSQRSHIVPATGTVIQHTLDKFLPSWSSPRNHLLIQPATSFCLKTES